MPQHIDILEEREHLGRSFAGSIVFHVGLLAMIAGVGVLQSTSNGITLGTDNPGGKVGSVAITPVNSIPLPSTEGPKNPVANDTPSLAPVKKEPPKPVTKAKPEPKKIDPNALPVPGGFTKKQYAEVNKFREKQEDRPNQLYSTSGQQLSSDMFAIQGSGRMGLGENAPFGNRFGAYAEVLRNLVASHWKTSDIDARIRTLPQAIVTFTLRRDGSISNVKLSQSSGNSALDRSAQRAILDSQPFPPMPAQFPKDQTGIDFVFELKR